MLVERQIENAYIVLSYLKKYISNDVGKFDNCRALPRQLTFLPTECIVSFIYGNTMYIFYLSFSV